MHTEEICGVEITIFANGPDVLVDVGGEILTPAEINDLRPSADWSRTVEIGPYTFDETSLEALRSFVQRGAGPSETGSVA
jgi:hypothetical protein